MSRIAGDGVAEGGEGVETVAGSGEVVADAEPGLGAGLGAVAAGDLELGLNLRRGSAKCVGVDPSARWLRQTLAAKRLQLVLNVCSSGKIVH